MSLPSGEREKVLSLTRELNAMGEEAVRKRALAAGASKRDVDARIHGPRAEIAALILAAAPDSAAVSPSRRVAFDTAPLPAGLARVQSDAAPALRASRVERFAYLLRSYCDGIEMGRRCHGDGMEIP